MFYFGDSETNALLFVNTVATESGPGIKESPLDEMTESEMRIAMAYLYAAIKAALYQGSDEAVLEKLTEWYDESFSAVAEASEAFRERMAAGAIIPPHGVRHRTKYLELAGLLRNPSDS